MTTIAPSRERPALAGTTAAAAAPRRRLVLGLAVLGVVLLVAIAASLAIGSKPLGLGTVWRVLGENDGSDAAIIVHELRLPRTVLGVLVGLALGMAGSLMQGHTRNPLADPALLGITAGASVAVVAAIKFLSVTSPIGYVWFAMAGSVVAAVTVYLIGSGVSRTPSPLSLVLAGTAVTALLVSLTTSLLVNDLTTINAYRFWIVGSLAGRGMDVATQLAPFLIAGVVVALAHSPALNLLSLGDDIARGLGQNLGRARAVGLLATTLLAGAATAACGPIAFVGLVVPHVARAWTGPDYRFLMPYAGLLGAILLLVSDIVGRVVVRPGELQVGIVLALIGGPFFIALVRRRRLSSL
ncbi:MAG: iron ABC transporter permease [Propionibacteriales bacterium]|nr:iron ABC transporter permease [Propionibacteriales bacterium]